MRRESDNLNNSSNNTPHSSYTAASNLSGDNNLTHVNYPHPVHSYSTSAGYSGYQSSKKISLALYTRIFIQIALR